MNRSSLRLALFALAALSATLCWSQTNLGRILGTVRDSSGSVIVGAQITIANSATNVTRTLRTNDAGEYVAPSLEPGTYVVTAESQGFKKEISKGLVLEVSRDARQDFRLQPGSVTETVEVTGEGSLVDTTNTTLNGVLENKAINELPVQGRDFQNLLELHPGVQRTPGGGFHSVTSNGNRPDDNNFFIDGADDNDAYYGETVLNEAGISGTPASFLPLDAIQEFNTQESPSADYGVKPGVVMNIGIKSGTNQVHGSAYYFHRNAAFDARNYFNPSPQPTSALLMHEFGASIGGPIKKDKWFYFLNYEGIRNKVGNPGITYSPVTTRSLAPFADQLAEQGYLPEDYSLVDAIDGPNGCQASSSCNPLSVSLRPLFLDNPGYTASATDPSAINFDFINKNRGDNLVAKTDYVLNSKNVLSARFIYGNTNQTEEDTLPLRPEWLSTTAPITQVFGVSWTSNPTSAWSNDVRFSFNKFDETIVPVDHTVNPMDYGLNTGVTDPRLFGFPRISPGSNTFNYMGGNSSWPLATTPSKTYNFSDTASYTHGRHTLRFGGSFRTGDVDYYRAGYGRGRVDFSYLENFVAGDVRRWRFLYGDPARDVSQKSMGFFLQDDVKASSRITLNLGLRYDITKPIKDSHNQFANFDPNSPSGLTQVGQGISSPYPTNYNNISPRVGVAWDMFGTGKTVFRSGFGIIFEQPSIRTFMFNGGGLNLNPSGIPYVDLDGVTHAPTGNITSFLQITDGSDGLNWIEPNQSTPIFPASFGSSCSIDVQCDIFGVDPHLKTPYVMNWNFNVQQELSKSTVLQLAYVANHGVKLYSVVDPNQYDPAYQDEFYGRPLTLNCPVEQGGAGLGGPCLPWIGYLSFLGNRSNSNYQSLQVTLTKRYSKGLYLLAGYTWAHAIDTATSNLAGVPPDSSNYNAERGDGDYDIRNRFTLSATYEFPSVKSKWQMLEGWQATTILNLQSGEPFTLGDFNDDISGTAEYNDRWNMTGPASNIHWSQKSPLPFVSWNAFSTDDDGNVIGNQQCINAAGGATTDAAYNLLNYGCYVSGSTVITPPAYYTAGNMGRNIFRGPRFTNWDFSLSKIWKLNERMKVQFRGEVFNILNHANFDVFSMNTDLSDPGTVGTVIYTPDVAAANPVIGSGGSRHIQVAAKLIW